MLYDGLDAVQINDGLNETAACAGAAVYDRANGLMFVSYVTGLRKRYGESTVFPDGIQSRPDVFLYRNEPMVVYNYKSDREILDFPPMHNHRNAVRFLYRGAPVLELFSKYGIVEHETVPIAGDLYFAFSNCPQALSTENGAAWIEEGRPVEQGKEALQWAKLPDIGEKIRSLS